MAIRKIIRLGRYSAGISFPKNVLRKLRWRRGQRVLVTPLKEKVEVKDFPNK